MSHGSVVERYRLVMSPKGAEGVSELIRDGINADSLATKKGQSVARGAAQPCCGTFRGCNVARECRAALLGNDVGLKRLPRVLKVSPGLFKTASMRTLQRRKSGKALPEGVAQNCCGTFRGCNVARECRTALLWNV